MGLMRTLRVFLSQVRHPFPLVLSLWLFLGSLHAERLFGEFEGAPLLVDVEIELPAVNQNRTTAVAPSAGHNIQVQLFVPDAANRVTLGYNLELTVPGFNIESLFSISGTDFS